MFAQKKIKYYAIMYDDFDFTKIYLLLMRKKMID